MDEQELIEGLLEQPYWVIDFLPRQVPAESRGQFFAVEKYYLNPLQEEAFRRKITDVLLKLNCYYDFRVFSGGESAALYNPPPEMLAARIADSRDPVLILAEEERSLIALNRGDLCAAVYRPSESLLSLITALAGAEGLFVCQPACPLNTAEDKGGSGEKMREKNAGKDFQIIGGLSHAAVRTRSIAESIRYYTEVLGLREAFRMHREDGSLSTVYLFIAPGQYLELFSDGTRERITGPDVIGVCHLCLMTKDIRKSFEAVQNAGGPLDSDIKRGKSQCLMFWTHDPDGTQIEVMEMRPESLQAQADKRFEEADASSGEE